MEVYDRICGCGTTSPRHIDTCNPGENFWEIRDFQNLSFFRQSDLSIILSRAKIDEEADFDVKNGPKPQKNIKPYLFCIIFKVSKS